MENRIEQLSRFALNFFYIDMIYIDKNSHIALNFNFTKVPEALQPYYKNMLNSLQLNDLGSKYDVIFHTNSYKLNYISYKVYEKGEYIGSLIVGPYLLEEPTAAMIESVISDNRMSISLKSIIKQYYLSLPLLTEYKAQTTAEFISFLITTYSSANLDIANNKMGKISYKSDTDSAVSPEIVRENTENAMESLENRYKIENKMLHAIETGNSSLFEKTLKEESALFLNMADRIPNDPLRSFKNTAHTLNTLLRKAAEKGGLHPIYVDSLSSKYALQIEKCTSFSQISDLMLHMGIEYCDSVKKLSLKDYSSTVRKAIEYIRINFNNQLNLDLISSAIFVSQSELSRQFKKETGKNITDYINSLRINEAVFMLENDTISITEISYIVGFNDLNYFTKVFKKLKGMTPSEYRKNIAQF